MIFVGFLLGFFGTEIISSWMHKYLFHKKLWFIHESHHRPNKTWYEKNDIFSLFFAAMSIVLFLIPSLFCFSVGVGITVYGVVYFFIHDVFTHRRYLNLKTPNIPWVQKVVQQHKVHHQKSTQEGQGPYGLLFF